MKRTIVVVLSVAVLAAAAVAQSSARKNGGMAGASVKAALFAQEKKAWEAWKSKNAEFFRGYLDERAIINGSGGVETKEQILSGMASSRCEIRGYSLDENTFAARMVDSKTAILTYKASQDYTCNGKAGPTPVWVTAMYVRRGGKWLNIFYQETQAEM